MSSEQRVCAEAIYQVCLSLVVSGDWQPVRGGGSPRNHCEPVKYQPLGNTRPIAERPPASPNASNRAIRKSDLIIGARNRSAVVTLTKHTTRHTLPAALPDGYQKHQPLILIGAPGAGLTLSKLPQRLHMEQPPRPVQCPDEQPLELAVLGADYESFQVGEGTLESED